MLGIKDIACDHVADMTEQASSKIAMMSTRLVDAELAEAIKRHLGANELDVEALPGILSGRMVAAHMPNGTVEYRIDDRPILRLGPIRIDLSDGVLSATRDVWRLL